MRNCQGLYVYEIIYLLLHDLKTSVQVVLIWSQRKPINTKLILMMSASVFHTSLTIGQVFIKEFSWHLEALIIVGTKFPEFWVALNVKLSICGNDYLFKVSQIKWGMEVSVNVFFTFNALTLINTGLCYSWAMLFLLYRSMIALHVTIMFEIFKKEVS